MLLAFHYEMNFPGIWIAIVISKIILAGWMQEIVSKANWDDALSECCDNLEKKSQKKLSSIDGFSDIKNDDNY